MTRIIFICFAFLLLCQNIFAAEWQWSVPVKSSISSETGELPTAFLWIPPDCKQVRGVVIGQHNMLEEGILEHSAFRKNLSALGLAEIWITPSVDMVFNFSSSAVFFATMKNLAEISGYSELAFAPVIPIGHSAAASYPWNFAAYNPDRTIAVLSIHGDAPLTNMTGSGKPNPDWGGRNLNGIPGLFVMGEDEWLEGRISPAMKYRKDNPDSPIALFCDAGHGHFDYSDELIDYLNLFISKAVKTRLPKKIPLNTFPILSAIQPQKGWLVDRWRKDELPNAVSAPYHDYKGNKAEAGWVFDGQMAKVTEDLYKVARAKIKRSIGFMQNGKLLPPAGFAGFRPLFDPLADGITFHVSAINTDTATHAINVLYRPEEKIVISRICGPVRKINDTTFQVAFYRMGFNNTKRSNDIWLMASQKGDAKYRSSVQQANMKIPLSNLKGIPQKITFPEIADQKKSVKSMKLVGRSDAGLPLQYFVKEGPVEIVDGILYFTAIPPRSKLPLKVTLVAWQYGANTPARQVQSAVPIQRTFSIIN
ncbi:hypothetical protein QF042_004654 [Pedobacter sp. W3I1]|uniref:hypothetical protein n=1 Tax=Pedobacter sp. W3I1 TaxID=3042291 RepID=UPI002789CCC4|nr:hypothetical protein [Pedobacter sp. W3I1]MDQ0641089.1 hypothetical protein [Pedobacter sp. W3I1]